jgi:type II restriction enzyme
MSFTVNDIYNLLIQDRITQSQGTISINFLDISVDINAKDAIGHLFQEWLAAWMRAKDIKFRTVKNTQEFPDFLLDEISDQKSLLEVKTFDYNRSANFDVANFEAYCRSLLSYPYRLDADYLIFAYELIDSKFSIKNLWLKKIWEITGASADYPVKCQVKQNIIYNIRPISWYSSRAKFSPFNNKSDFVEALHQTLLKYPKTSIDNTEWLDRVKQNYLEHTGESL